ncbi:MAG: cupin domain-containing protein [Candidatus Heimdallarchaeota archaeon]
MVKYRQYRISYEDLSPVRSDFTSGISGKAILPKEWSDIKLTITKVVSQGEFPAHIDAYHHIFYFISGIGTLIIEDEQIDITPGLVVEIPAGLSHGYKNTGSEEMILLTGNIPVKKFQE